MWFHKLSYPRRQIYAVPYITECFYAGSAIIIAVLVTVNIALVGNDVVTELKHTPDFTETKWWAPKWVPNRLRIPTTPGPCQPLTLPQRSTSIQTNSTIPIFTYTLINGLGTSRNANGEGGPKWYNAPQYRAEPLKNCIVQNITALINIQDRRHELTALIVCDIDSADPETPPSLKLSATFSRAANTDLGSDDVVDYISSYTVPQSTDIAKAQAVPLAPNIPALKLLGVLDAIGSDLLKAMWAQKLAWNLTGRNNTWPEQAVVKWAAEANCTDPTRCRETGDGVEGIYLWYSNTRGQQDFNPEYFAPMNTTMYNYFVAFRDALYLDLGHFNERTNVFLDNDAFQVQILSDPFLGTIAGNIIGATRPPPNNQPYSSDDFWRTCTWGWGCLNGTWTDALLRNDSAASNITNGLPLSSLESQYPTIIDVKFLCPVFRRKQTGALLISVFVGTFSMYAVLCGIFLLLAPIFDQRYRRRHGYREVLYYSKDHEAMGDDRPHLHTAESFGSAFPYATMFNAPRVSHHNPAIIQPYDLRPDHVFVRTPRKSDELPPGAFAPGAPGAYTPKHGSGANLPSPNSQLALSRTISSRDTANLNQRGSTQHLPTVTSPRALAQTSRSLPPPQMPRKPHSTERE